MITPDQLRTVAVLAELSHSELEWLIAHGQEAEYQAGEVFIRDGDAPEWLYILLQGEVEFYWANSSHAIYITRAGEVVGALPHSRMVRYNGSGRAALPVRSLNIHRDIFPALLAAIPALDAKLIGVMTDRVRSITQLNLREEKLLSLGKLAAGLAHELNNPAAAANRAAAQFVETAAALQRHSRALARQLEPEQFDQLCQQVERLHPRLLSAFEQSELEQNLSDWLEDQGMAQAWEIAPTLAEAGVSPAWLEALQLPDEVLIMAVGWLEAHLRTRLLALEIALSTQRISELVGAVKRYTYMDQSPKQEVDIHQSLEDTLTLHHHRLDGVTIQRLYDPNLPRIMAFGSELNQVWSNLIGNALDAMDDSGTLTLRTVLEHEIVVVEITDSGPGIPAEIRGKVFDPFFSTKPPGKGAGLGLSISNNIIRQHKGAISVGSTTSGAVVRVSLPLV